MYRIGSSSSAGRNRNNSNNSNNNNNNVLDHQRRRNLSGNSKKKWNGGEEDEGGDEEEKNKKVAYIYRVNDGTGQTGSLLHEVFKERGWREFSEELSSSSSSICSHSSSCAGNAAATTTPTSTLSQGTWNLWWRNGSFKSSALKQLSPNQLTNHIPKATSAFCRKDYLARYLRRMHRTHGPLYDFSPMSFNLPLEYRRLCSEHSRRKRMHEGRQGDQDGNHGNSDRSRSISSDSGSPIWICKPVGRSQGRGIRVFDQVAEIAYDSSSVVQEYIRHPFLIGGYKWDLRIYVCITSIRPLRIYAYREGLARFATNKYDLNALSDPFSHLTNVSLNKQNPAYRTNKEQIGQGSKWTLGRLRRHLYKNGVSDWFLWQRIMSILVLTILGEAHTLTHLDVAEENCFEFLGFDILVTEDLEPTLLEVNTNPSLGRDSNVDELVKRPMLHQLLSLLGLPDERESKGQETDASCTNRQNSKCLPQVSGEPTPRPRLILRQSSLNSLVSAPDNNCVRAESGRIKGHELKNDNEKLKNCGRDELGGWVRIFPFDAFTVPRNANGIMSVHDVKIGISRMQSYLRIAQRINAAGLLMNDDERKDKLGREYGKLISPPWHPILNLNN